MLFRAEDLLYLISVLTITYAISQVHGNANNEISLGPVQDRGLQKPIITDLEVLSPCSMNVSWKYVPTIGPSAGNFTVFWKETEDPTSNTLESPTVDFETNEYLIEGLQASTDYTVWVSHVGPFGIESKSDGRQNTTMIGDPPALSNLTVSDITSTTMLLNWNEPIEYCPLGRYTIQWNATVSWDPDKSVTGKDSSEETTYLMVNLIPDAEYYIWVAAVATDGIIGEPLPIASQTNEGRPGPPRNLALTSVNSSSVTLRWSEPPDRNGVLSNYTVRWGGPDLPLGIQSTDLTEATIDELLACGNYIFTVQASTEEGGRGDPSNITAETSPEAPPPVTDLEMIVSSSRWVNLTWTAPDTHCPVWTYTLTGIGSILWNDEPTTVLDVIPGDVTYFLEENLIPWTDYSLTISPTTEGGTADPGNNLIFTTDEDVPSEPTNLDTVVLSSTEINLNWDAPIEVNGKLLFYNISWTDDSNKTLSTTTNEITYSFDDLIPCAPYLFTVTGATEVGEGPSANTTDTLAVAISPPPIIRGCSTTSSSSILVLYDAPDTKCTITSYPTKAVDLRNGTVVSDMNGHAGHSELHNLDPYTEYQIFVTAKTEAGVSKPDTCKATTLQDVPSHPEELSVVEGSIKVKSMTIRWKGPSKENGKMVGFNVTWGSNMEFVPYFGNSSTIYTMDIKNLEKNTAYNISVIAETEVGYGPPSSILVSTENNALGLTLGILFVILVVGVLCFFGYKHRETIENKVNTLKTAKSTAEDQDETSEISTTPIPLSQLKLHVCKLITGNTLKTEYDSLASKSFKGSTIEGDKQQNQDKNRYSNILPYDETRVKLTIGPSDYINANYVTSFKELKYFIAAQGPKDNTLEDFWNLIWQENVDVIVMLTDCVESGKEKCSQYWPKPLGYGTDLGNYSICNISEEATSTFAFRMLEVTCKTDHMKRLIKQYQLTSWPDFGVPTKEDDLLRLMSSIKQHLRMNRRQNKMLVHCSAGVGRTGTFIGLWNAVETIDSGLTSISVYKEVLNLRRFRMLMVQSKEQYLYLYRCVIEYYENRHKWQVKSRGSASQSNTSTEDFTDHESSQYLEDEEEMETSAAVYDNSSFEPTLDFQGNLI